MSKELIIYHGVDLDGYCSAAIAKLAYPNADTLAFNYGDDMPNVADIDTVIMVDVSLPMNQMEGLHLYLDFIWIDHHISAINSMKERGLVLHGLCRTDRAACELTWEYFFPERPMPTAVRRLGKYDSWRNEDKSNWNNHILPFQYGMREICTQLNEFPIDNVIDDSPIWIQEVTNSGKAILLYQYKQNKRSIDKGGFEINFESYRALALNTTNFSSQTFESVYDESLHDIMIAFKYNGNDWNVSVYSTKSDVDCSVIAKKYGGGGHKGAAGFKLSDISIILKGES